jgi:hypothetical protein
VSVPCQQDARRVSLPTRRLIPALPAGRRRGLRGGRAEEKGGAGSA